MPSTTNGIHIWNDQLLARAMTEQQMKFAATHYDGTQKILRSYADKFRSYNPNFLILHYRLGQALGYRVPQGNCQPTGEVIHVMEGNQWVPEYPGDAVVKDNWFYHYAGSNRVFFCDWGSYLMETDDAGWRSYWWGEVARQLAANDNDGVFMDSLSVPNYLGRFNPAFPAVDATFEKQWSDKSQRWLVATKQQFGSRYLVIPNAGHWVTTRDVTDYSPADGVMIEGFAKWDQYTLLELADWKLQMNRILNLERQNKIIIAQSYLSGPDDLMARNFYIANYLLVKGARTFVNLELGQEPEWFPEYDIPIGSPTDSLPVNVDGWRDAATGLYRRSYSNGMVLVNPTNTTLTMNLGKTYYLARASGGGYLPADGVPTGSINYQATNAITLTAGTAAILVNTINSSVPNVTTVSAASYRGAEVARDSIASAFGSNLATTAQSATTLPLPTALAGASVKVRDSAGTERFAPLFYVSPTQINYQIPPGTANGAAEVSVLNNGLLISKGTLIVMNTMPGVFSATADGKGLAAASVQRVRNGVPSYEQTSTVKLGQVTTVPIDVSSLSEEVYLVLYTTGVRYRSDLANVTATIGGTTTRVTFAGAQGTFVGLDQINVLLPRSLAGRGEVDIELRVDGQIANTVRVNIK
ncbi:MAG TPA: putative glycoside hydrolase [Blastocatellia bacterium]|nr:putative glycoside hydrolase [Blastocatellia bacterium]